jgi:hypothetical protein
MMVFYMYSIFTIFKPPILYVCFCNIYLQWISYPIFYRTLFLRFLPVPPEIQSQKKYAYSYYLCHVTSLPNVRQHHLPNLDFFPQRPTLSWTYSIVRTLHPLNTRVPGIMSMKVDTSLRPWCCLSMHYYKLSI